MISQNPASEVSQSDSRIDHSDSLMDESLLFYTDKFMSGHQKNNISDEPSGSSYNLSKSSFDRPAIYTRLDDIKAKFRKNRLQILEGTSYPKKNVIATLTKNDQFQTELNQKLQKLNKIKQEEEDKNQEKIKLELSAKELENEIKLFEQMNQFKNKIKDLLTEVKLEQKQGQDQGETQDKILQILQARTRKVLQKLRPYLEYEKAKNQQQNERMQKMNVQLDQDKKKYNEQIEKIEKQFEHKKSLKEILDIQNEVEIEKNYAKELNNYTARNDRDIQIWKNKKK